MPRAPLSLTADEFLREPRPAVMATVRSDGLPVTAACWYDWVDGQLLLSMDATAARLEHLRDNPGVAITVLGDSWYTHLSLIGSVAEIRTDPDMIDLDALSHRYRGRPYDRYEGHSLVTVLVDVERWHSWRLDDE
jgi:PPOX class probable F420-dependent enzyme